MSRDNLLLIPDVQAYRRITKFLGLLGLNTCRTHNPPPPPPWSYGPNHKEWYNGLGLKETKDMAERTFDYVHVKNSPLDRFVKDNVINEIKRTRQLLSMLVKLGLNTPNHSLKPCKDFVDRMRARRP